MSRGYQKLTVYLFKNQTGLETTSTPQQIVQWSRSTVCFPRSTTCKSAHA